MEAHQAPLPIIVEIFDGDLEFGIEGKKLNLTRGDILTLDSKVPHDLRAKTDCIVRLSLSKKDNVNRVNKVVD